MINEADKEWLAKYHPSLKLNSENTALSGEFPFSAAYDKSTEKFTPLTLSGQTASGIVLSGLYNIVIDQMEDKTHLPRLRVLDDNIVGNADRHFYADSGGKACLCGPAEEINFIKENISLPEYIEKLVTPFLYGQRYYDSHNNWPWKDYLHGTSGIFQSYHYGGKTIEHAKVCLQKLQADKNSWPRVKKALRGSERINGSSRCFCAKYHQIRMCDPYVWFGFLKLRKILRENGIYLND